MDIIGKHMQSMRLEKKRELSNLYSRLMFPQQGQNWTGIKWTTHWGVTFVTMWDEDHLIKNIKFSMIQELMGLGPMKYYIVYNEMPNFSSWLLLLINYLPHQNMCFFLPWFPLAGPFLHSSWRKIGKEICGRTFRLKSPLIRTLYYSQQFQNFLQIGIYGHSIFV